MTITVIFDVPGMTAVQYDNVMADLENVGVSAPAGRLYHNAAAKPDGWLVVDVWESPAHLDQFAQTLMPVLAQNGVTPPQPQVYPTHNVIAP
jgi:hypothetical protein